MSQPPDDEDTWDETSGNPVHADQEVPVGAALAVLRIAVGLDPVELATACSVRALTILDYEQGRQVPALKVLERMLQAEGFPLPALESARTLIASLRAESTAARQPLPLARDAREFSPPAALGEVIHKLRSICLWLGILRRVPRRSNGSHSPEWELSDDMRSRIASILADHLAPALKALESAPLQPAPPFQAEPLRALADHPGGIALLVDVIREKVAQQGGCILDLEEFGLSPQTAREVAVLGGLAVSLGLKAVFSPG